MIKLDIGSGYKPKGGEYITIDRYIKADIRADILRLPFADNSVDEIWCEHVLEHLQQKYFIPAIKELYRILKVSGKLEIRLPDIIYTLKGFLTAEYNERWDLWWRRIYGAQIHPGEFHLTCFDKERVERLLTEAGFINFIVTLEYSQRHTQTEICVVIEKGERNERET